MQSPTWGVWTQDKTRQESIGVMLLIRNWVNRDYSLLEVTPRIRRSLKSSLALGTKIVFSVQESQAVFWDLIIPRTVKNVICLSYLLIRNVLRQVTGTDTNRTYWFRSVWSLFWPTGQISGIDLSVGWILCRAGIKVGLAGFKCDW